MSRTNWKTLQLSHTFSTHTKLLIEPHKVRMAESTKCIYITCTLLTTGTYVFMVNQKLLTEHCASLVNTASTEQGNWDRQCGYQTPSSFTCSMACMEETPNCICVGDKLVTCFGSESEPDMMETTTYPASEDDGKHKTILLYACIVCMCNRDFITNHYHEVYVSL